MDFQIMRIGTMLNKLFIILIIILTSCKSHNSHFSPLTSKSLSKEIEVENPVLMTILLNKYILYSNKLPKEALSKHNAAIHSALMDKNNGKTYYWKHYHTKGIDKQFQGKIKIVNTTSDQRGICRTWIEELSKNNRFILTGTSTACLNNEHKYQLADEFFYDKF